MGLRNLRVGMAQINPTVGDLGGNAEKIVSYISQAKKQKIDLLTFPELSLPGYPPEDLLLKPSFLKDNLKSLKGVAGAARDIVVIVGFANTDRQGNAYNAAALVYDGKIAGIYHKIHLPNYGVFDEKRYFQAGNECLVFVLKGISLGITICEDIWCPDGPAAVESGEGKAEVILNISASPYHVGKGRLREKVLS
ncbi:MAG: NAD+ synthase, partial [Nitrospirae bacterium]|nr:NAD+ synthase [Nitrospirota bacterium]